MRDSSDSTRISNCNGNISSSSGSSSDYSSFSLTASVALPSYLMRVSRRFFCLARGRAATAAAAAKEATVVVPISGVSCFAASPSAQTAVNFLLQLLLMWLLHPLQKQQTQSAVLGTARTDTELTLNMRVRRCCCCCRMLECCSCYCGGSSSSSIASSSHLRKFCRRHVPLKPDSCCGCCCSAGGSLSFLFSCCCSKRTAGDLGIPSADAAGAAKASAAQVSRNSCRSDSTATRSNCCSSKRLQPQQPVLLLLLLLMPLLLLLVSLLFLSVALLSLSGETEGT